MKKFLRMLLIMCMALTAAGCVKQKDPQEDADHYAGGIFDVSRVHTIEIRMSEEDRADQLANPKEKTKYRAVAVIDDEEIADVGFHTKGNSSLYFTADAGRDKFSYEIEFSRFTKDQSFHGIDSLNLQNNIGDATSMKEYMAFWLFRRTGTDAPLSSYAWLIVNGEEQGLFTILEEMDDSFLARTADGKGTIYKPEDAQMGLSDEEMESIISGNSAAHDSGGGADLVYRDDNEESYPDIFENAETEEGKETRTRVIRALKALSEKKDLKKYLDTEEIISYFAVHDFLVAYDSYTGPMLHNYCLYENDGRLAMLPWDYDNAYGSFPPDARMDSAVDSSDVINAGIDSPLAEIEEPARPMFSWILSDDSFLNAYHDRLKELTDIIESGEYEKEAERIYNLILPYVRKDMKALYRESDFRKAYETLLMFAELRADSVRKQVNGQLASRSKLQKDEDKTDASGLSIPDMGSMLDLMK